MDTIPELIEDIRQGKMVILVDDEDRENEGDLIMAADHITPTAVNFMISEAKGLVCLSLAGKQIQRLGLSLMVHEDLNLSPNKTAFTVSIEAAEGVTTGISAADRARTIRVASHPDSTSKDITIPGHVFPIRAQDGGVLKRAGHTEASVDLAELAGLTPAAVICEVMNQDGSMARIGDLKNFAKKHDLKMGSIEELIQYRIEHESFVEEIAHSVLPTHYGENFSIRVFRNQLDGRQHIVIVKGEIDPTSPVLVRVHSECVMGDLFGSFVHRSGDYLRAAFEKLNEEKSGVILYLRLEDMEGRLGNRIQSYSCLMSGKEWTPELHSAFQSDKKDYGVGAQILRALGIRKIRLMTNSPSKRVGLKGYGLEIVETVNLRIEATTRPPVTASPLDERRGADEEPFRFYRPARISHKLP